MITFTEAQLSRLSVHRVGNKSEDGGIILSEKEVPVHGVINDVLTTYFTKPFKPWDFYQFTHETDLNFNEIYSYARNIFNEPSTLHIESVKIAKHLYEQSVHPKIKSGELYVALFKDCVLDGVAIEVLGIFKSEQKETYLKVYPEGSSFSIDQEQGININKLDKGCLIFNDIGETGYRVLLVDNTNKEDTQYWKDRFLNVEHQRDNYHHTANYLQMCRDFAVEAFPEADRIDQVSLIQESARFFKEEDLFDKARFQEKVLQEPEIIEAFENFKNTYQEEREVQIFDEFDINPDAVKNLKRVFKSVIKLDKNFHIYVHGNRNLIRKGYDDQSKMSFYQLFFKEEH